MLSECVRSVHALTNVTGCGVLSIAGAGSGSLTAAVAARHVHAARSVDWHVPRCLLTTLRAPWLRFLSGVRYDSTHSRRRPYSTAAARGGDADNADTASAAVAWLRALDNASDPWHANAWRTRQASAAPRYGVGVDGARDGNNFLVPQVDWLRGVLCDVQTVYVVCADAADDWARLHRLSGTVEKAATRANVRNRGRAGHDSVAVRWARARIEQDLYWWDTQLWAWVCRSSANRE